ncbi:glycosyltransferase family 4 protein [Luteipulveratus mongoliensis]|uniref:glycosyltransferase family 4 protein n=1 Tax=Luteipulveratus mongoliensis TaxID=571913 RepID=UPI0006969ECF|nr:glycosyltransferase family 4 protein [Luteipulveratus mongoliensis]
MKILHVTDSYLPCVGGIELHISDLARLQRQHAHDVTVAAWSLGSGASPETSVGGEQVRRLARVGRRELASLAPDVVHIHVSIVSPFALSAAATAARQGIPTVVTVHSWWKDLARVTPLIRSSLGVHRWPVVWSAVSEQAATYVRQVVGAPVDVIPNAVDLEYWRAGAAEPESTASRLPTVLSVMRLTTLKRTLPLARILHTVAERTPMRAVVIGDGPSRPALETYVRRHGLQDRVILAGQLDREAVRRAMTTSSVFLAPAHRESFGIAALEARTAGLPVVAHRGSGVASFVRHGHEGLLARDDREMAEHVTTLVRDRAVREQLSRHNREQLPVQTWAAALAHTHRAYRAAGADQTAADPILDRESSKVSPAGSSH